MERTLDQRRAAFAWDCVTDRNKKLKGEQWKKYRDLAKGAPGLIMNSGLMPTLAFYEGKGKDGDRTPWMLLDDVMRGLFDRLNGKHLEADKGRPLFDVFMRSLHQGSSQDYLRATDEALEILKWIRQFVDAV
ncbi:MAG: type III-B CRISPR module-associated protein Cmr5 [Chromatiaceae bacterium]|jgi:CRISPR-associated protein Cmr5|nr:type III-B CRISPR module-associated protein Cmr5 [Chromatiaceae bacterium]